jgi:hypothetical protein
MTVDLAALAKLASEAAELLRGERDWFRWTEESDIPDAYIAAASPDVVLTLVRVALAAQVFQKTWDARTYVGLTDMVHTVLSPVMDLRAALADLDR